MFPLCPHHTTRTEAIRLKAFLKIQVKKLNRTIFYLYAIIPDRQMPLVQAHSDTMRPEGLRDGPTLKKEVGIRQCLLRRKPKRHPTSPNVILVS